MGTVITVTSGKGGTGKTTVTGGVASCLARLGKKVLCIDMDIGLRNLDISLGLNDRALMDFSDVALGRCPLDRAAVSHPDLPGLFLLTAPMTLSPALTGERVRALLSAARERYDYIMIDSPAGLGPGFRLAASSAHMGIIVSTGDASSLRDGQKTALELRRLGVDNLRLIVNRVQPRQLKYVKTSIDDIIDVIGARLLGLVSEDESVALAANLEKPLMIFGARLAFDQFLRIARRLLGQRAPIGRV